MVSMRVISWGVYFYIYFCTFLGWLKKDIPLRFVRYEMVIATSAHPSPSAIYHLLTYYLISNARVWNNS